MKFLKSKHFLVYSLIIILICAFITYLFLSITSMINVPFNEFDEAHRAETAKRMKEYHSFLVPITGSVYDRVLELRIPLMNDQFKFLYFHLERPPLVYDLMILSTSIFGASEFTYRLPSFLLGMSIFVIFLFFAKVFSTKINGVALIVGLSCLLTSSDLWLSSQYAQLDTGISAFLFLSLLSLITYAERKKEIWLFTSGISFALAILSKGQPAIVLIPVVVFLVFNRKVSLRSVLRFFIYALSLLVPWLGYVSYKFGPLQFFEVFGKFAFTTSALDIVHHEAPIFWYGRWWLESFRPGWSLFWALFLIDLIKRRNFDYKKVALLIYILFNFFWLSINPNKLWWYVLPLLPAVCFYIYLSVSQYLEDKKLLTNLGLAIIIVSRNPLTGASNTLALFNGVFFVAVIFYILYILKLTSLIKPSRVTKIINNYSVIFIIAIIFCFVSFYSRFPQIIPYHWNMKPVATYFKNLPGEKCLWIYEVPTESVLFYSDIGEVYTYNPGSSIPYGYCQNYVITSFRFDSLPLEYRVGNMKLYKFDH